MRLSPTQLAVVRAIDASEFNVVEHGHLAQLTGRRVTWATMNVLLRRRIVLWSVIGCTWTLRREGREPLRTSGVL